MQTTLIETDGKWAVDTRLTQPTDDEYYVSTVSHPDAEPGDTVDVLIGDDDVEQRFDGVILATDPVLTVSSEVQDAF